MQGVFWGVFQLLLYIKIKKTINDFNPCLDESQAGIKIARRNVNNLIYANDATLMAERKEYIKSLLMRAKEESEKAGLKLKKTKMMASGPIILW